MIEHPGEGANAAAVTRRSSRWSVAWVLGGLLGAAIPGVVVVALVSVRDDHAPASAVASTTDTAVIVKIRGEIDVPERTCALAIVATSPSGVDMIEVARPDGALHTTINGSSGTVTSGDGGPLPTGRWSMTATTNGVGGASIEASALPCS